VLVGCANPEPPVRPDLGTWCGGLLAAQHELLDTSCSKNSDCALVSECCGSASYLPTHQAEYFLSLDRNVKEDCAGPEPVCDSRPNLPAVCLGGKCQACYQPGTRCTEGGECCSLACLEGECACGISGTPCHSHSDCCSGVCSDPDLRAGDGCPAYCR
jgi:hypothetical protein